VDPPCSDLGTLASRPDARWRKSPELIERLAAVQGAIAARALGALAPGGTLVYSTCTISRREGEDRVAELLGRGGAQATRVAAAARELASTHDRRFLQVRPDRDRTDGFFIARLESA
jgi:16S rRNA (cytosine967-C5)-methyltransferase